MAELILIDTSAWIAFFRGDEPVATLVERTLAEGNAAFCGVVELELRQGIRPEEREEVFSLLSAATRLPTEETDWAPAGDLLASLRRKGITVPGTDGLIAHLALRHKRRCWSTMRTSVTFPTWYGCAEVLRINRDTSSTTLTSPSTVAFVEAEAH